MKEATWKSINDPWPSLIIARMQDSLPQAAARRLATERNIWIATVRPDGRPHLVPVWFVWDGEKIFASFEPGSVKARNLKLNPRVSLALEGGSHPVICEGAARFVEKPWSESTVALFREKYDWDISTERRYTLLVEILPDRWLQW